MRLVDEDSADEVLLGQLFEQGQGVPVVKHKDVSVFVFCCQLEIRGRAVCCRR